MEKYLNTGIKEIITKFPKVADILNEYNIGCVPCTLGSCLLKDIVEIHNLAQNKKIELMYRIEKEIYPGREVKKPVFAEINKETKPKEIKYSPPIKKLVNEHALIKKLLAAIPVILENFDINSQADRKLILGAVDFIRNYADKFHHIKEEDRLFEYVDRNLDIIKTILQDHDIGRGHVKAVLEALDRKDKLSLAEHLCAYKELLTEHIKKEDEILYPWIDRGLTTRQVGEMFEKFNQAEEKINKEVVERCKRFIEGLDENNLQKKIATTKTAK